MNALVAFHGRHAVTVVPLRMDANFRLQSAQHAIRGFTIAEPCIQIDFPCGRPAEIVTTTFKNPPHRRREFGRAPRSDLVAWISRVEMRNMAMLRFRFGIIIKPLQKLALLANLNRRQPRQSRLQLASQVIIHSQLRSSFEAFIEEIAQQFGIESRPGAKRVLAAVRQKKTVFRRRGRARHQPVVFWILHQIVQTEFRCAL